MNVDKPLNYIFFPQYIGVTPSRAKTEFVITCTRMLRTPPNPNPNPNLFNAKQHFF